MILFVYEHITAEEPEHGASSTPPSLLTEGRAMRDAVADDARLVPGLDVVVFRPRDDFDRLAAQADFTLVIAPEFEGILEQFARRVVDVGGRLLGPEAGAIRVTSDKQVLADHWRNSGVPTPETHPYDVRIHRSAAWVIKPRDGAGSQGVRRGDLLPESSDSTASSSESSSGWIAQRRVDGTAVSMAMLIGPEQLVALRPCRQLLSDDGRYGYLGGEVLPDGEAAERTRAIAVSAVQGIPGLFGYVGVDAVLGEDGRDWAIEVNPRLTTSYVGLRSAARSNLVEAMLRIRTGQAVMIEWNDRCLRFEPDGRVFDNGPWQHHGG